MNQTGRLVRELMGGQVHEFAGLAIQGTCDLENHDQVGQVLSALDLAHVRPLDLRQIGQFFLGQTQLEAALAYHLTKSHGRSRLKRGGPTGSARLDFAHLHDRKLCVKSLFGPRYI